MDLFKKCYDYTRIDDLKQVGLYPYFHYLTTGQDTVVQMEGKRTIMIGSNNYLGLTSNQEVIDAGVEAIKKYGSGCSGSRFLNGTLDMHIQLEKELAEFLHKEDCVTFSTGDKENHASIYDACRLSFAKLLRYEHNNMEDLERQLSSIDKDKGILIVTDGVFSMSGEICNLPEIVRLAKKYGARVMVDDAHGLGVIGEGGRGTASHFGLEDEVDLIMGTFSKSLASLGGYVVCSAKVANYIRHNSRPFIFSASITPASVACARKSLEILKREPERVENLNKLGDYFREGLTKRNIKFIPGKAPIVAIWTYTDENSFLACKMLLERGVYVNPVISPAVPVGQSILRTSFTATHTKEQLDEAMDKIKEVLDIILKENN